MICWSSDRHSQRKEWSPDDSDDYNWPCLKCPRCRYRYLSANRNALIESQDRSYDADRLTGGKEWLFSCFDGVVFVVEKVHSTIYLSPSSTVVIRSREWRCTGMSWVDGLCIVSPDWVGLKLKPKRDKHHHQMVGWWMALGNTLVLWIFMRAFPDCLPAWL